MTHEERLVAVPKLSDMRRQDPEIGMMCHIVCTHHGVTHIGELAHYHPDVFDELFEECEALMETPT